VKHLKRAAVAVAVIALGVFGLAVPAHASAGRFFAAYFEDAVTHKTPCITAQTGLANKSLVYPTTSCNGLLSSWDVSFDNQGKATIRSSANSGKCLDVLDGNVFGPVGVFDCNGGANQKWNVAQLGSGLSMWGSTNNGTTCLTLSDNIRSPIFQSTCDQHVSRQIWRG
jgi:hypothetical protein